MKIASVIVFPGSNCDRDCQRALEQTGFRSKMVWHRDSTIEKSDLIVLPGGFSFGDYLRAGALAKVSPIMKEVVRLSKLGVPVIGICNGFQILLEAGLLPGAMTKNEYLTFICREQRIKVSGKTRFTETLSTSLNIPIAHGEGNYRIDDEGLKKLQDQDQIVFQYCDDEGNISSSSNPNGSVLNIAGVCSSQRNVLGMMPHPERAVDPILGSTDGALIFKSILNN